ncbi:hypothetical protein TGAMA5MH_01794 [Trichoderma gamsii]|uniref:Uncharacterized protein n=1 Tax=Trichoderma gamsii TaxID=398673 RepID=A0A2K0TMS9_9HYPO|nr:hypothetical protein TGAMA5MH_01794 [Trichoderma gamsii]
MRVVMFWIILIIDKKENTVHFAEPISHVRIVYQSFSRFF